MQNTAVPKFSSFRPKKPTLKTSPSAEAQKPQPKEPKDRDLEHRSKRRHHDESRSSKTKSSRLHRETSKPAEAAVKPKPVLNHDNNDDIESFIIDRKGDPLNLTYGGLDKRKVPKFWRVGAGSVLGLESRWKIDRRESTDKYIIIQPPYTIDTFQKPNYRKSKALSAKASRIILPGDSGELHDPDADFISLGKKRKRDSDDDDDEQHDGYRLTAPKNSKDDAINDPDVESDIDLDALPDYYDTRETKIKDENARLIRQARDTPENLQTWLDLLAHQDQMIRLGRREHYQELTGAETRSLADIKVSIYEEALNKSARNPDDQQILYLGMLEQGALIWEDKQLLRKWDLVVDLLPNSFKIRLGRISFLQTSFLSFSFERCKREYIQCLAMLKSQFNQKSMTQHNPIESQIYILLRLTSFLRDAGYHELALAIWQSSLDFAIFRPPSITEDTALEQFGSYWDSEALRLGEAKAASWATYQPESAVQPEPSSFDSGDIESAEDVFQVFARREVELQQALRMPGRTIDDAGEDDPFHVILFSDIEPILSNLIDLSIGKEILLEGFLCYLGLPPVIPDRCPEWREDPFLYSTTISQLDEPSRAGSLKYSDPVPETTDNIIRIMSMWKDRDLPDRDWPREVLLALADKFMSDDHFLEYIIAFLLIYDDATIAAKTAKKFIKSRSSSLRLYRAYYLIEKTRGKEQPAETVISTAINMSKDLGEVDQQDSILLWYTWIMGKLQDNSIDQAIHLLLSLGSSSIHPGQTSYDTSFNASAVLRSRQWLTDGQRQSLHNDNMSNFSMYSQLILFLTYFESDESLTSISPAFNSSLTLLTNFRKPTSWITSLHLSRAFLASYHASTSKLYRPADVQNILLESININLFPANTTLLQIYTQHEKSFGLSDRLHSKLPTPAIASLPLTIFAIEREMSRAQQIEGMSSIHAIRATFKRAIQSKDTAHSPLIWLSYLDFEISQGSISTMKEVLLTGMGKIPWVKSFILRGLDALSGRLPLKELKSIYNVLEDRELRTHLNLVDVLEEMGI